MYGTARFTWTDTVLQIHTLNVPLQKVRPSFRVQRWVRESINYANREVWAAGDGVHEIVGLVRYDEFPESLVEALAAGVKGTTITYYDGVEEYDCYLVEPGAVFDLDFDDLQSTEDWHLVEVRLRKTDGTAFGSSAFDGGVLFQLSPGHNAPAQGYTMNTFGNSLHRYVDKLGVLQYAGAANTLRVNWEWTNTITPYPDLPSFMVESPAATNLNDEDDVTVWGTTGTPVVTGSISDPAGGTDAYTVEDNSGASHEYVSYAIPFTGDAVKAVVFVVRENTMPSSGVQRLRITDTTLGNVVALDIDAWEEDGPSVTGTTGTYLGKVRLGNGYWALYALTVSVTAANTFEIRISPALTDSETGSIDVYRVRAYDDVVPFWSIVDQAANKNSEIIYWPYTHVPQESCGVVDFRELEIPNWTTESGTGRRILHIGNASNQDPRFFVWRVGSTDSYRVSHDMGGTSVTSTVDLNPSWGDRVQLFWWLFPDGSVQLAGRTQALGATAWSSLSWGTRSSALAFAGAWADERLYMGSVGTLGQARQLYYGLGMYRGSGASPRTLAARIGFLEA